jgi:hypothetical protein
MSTEYTAHLILREPTSWGVLAQIVPRVVQAVGRQLIHQTTQNQEPGAKFIFFPPPIAGVPGSAVDNRIVGLTEMMNQPPSFKGCCLMKSKLAENPNPEFGYGEALSEIEFWVVPEGITKRIESKHWIPWYPFANYDNEFARIDPKERDSHLAWQIEAARSYYLNRCLMRATNARLAYAQYNGIEYWHAAIYHWRPGRRSYVIPAFEEYCESVGYACVDNPDEPVQRVPHYVPTGKLWSAIQTLNI